MVTSFGLHYNGPTTPLNVSAPVVTGTATVGSTLTCSTGSWLGVQPITFDYQWYEDSTLISGATANTYVVVDNDIGFSLSCTVTATNSIAAVSANSNSVSINPSIPVGSIIMYNGANPSLSGWSVYSDATNRYIKGTGSQANVGVITANSGSVSGNIVTALAGAHGSIGPSFKSTWIAYPGTYGSSQALTSATAGNHTHDVRITSSVVSGSLPWTSDFTFLVATSEQSQFPANTIHIRDTGAAGWTQKLATNPGSPLFYVGRNIRGNPGSVAPSETAANSKTLPLITTNASGSHGHFVNDTNYVNPATGTSLGGGSYNPPSPTFVGSNPGPSPDGTSHTHTATNVYNLRLLPSRVVKLWTAAAATGALSNTMVLFSGTLSSVPSYWKLCDGFNGTVNMSGSYLAHSNSAATAHLTSAVKTSNFTTTASPDPWTHSHGYGTASQGNGGFASKDYWHTAGSSPHGHSNGSTLDITDTYTPDTVELAFLQYTTGGSISTFSVTPTTNTVAENATLTFNATATNAVDGSTLTWLINDGTANSTTDFSSKTGTVTITSGAGSFIVTPYLDNVTEGNETFTVSLLRGGSVVATSEVVTLTDYIDLGLTFTATARAAGGNVGNRTGWTLGSLTPTSYDDGSAGPYSDIIPSGKSWYMNGVAYSQLYISSNGLISFGAGWGSTTAIPTLQCIAAFPGDQYWGTNGANAGVNTPNGVAYKSGVTSTGINYFRINMRGYQYGSSYNDRSWEINCFWTNETPPRQYVEIVYPNTVNNISAYTNNPGIYGSSWVSLSSSYATPNNSVALQSSDYGTTWTVLGAGSWSGTGTF